MRVNKKYSYDDLMLVPKRSDIESRSDVVLETNITPNITVGSPLISAPMDSVTGPTLAQSMYDNGGVGILHRYSSIEDRIEWVNEVNGVVGASVGISPQDIENASKLENAGADFICVDVAHGHMERCLSFVEELNDIIDVDIMVGNVATSKGVKDLVKAGADSVKIGVGPGSHCTTREQTGHGYPQASAIDECSRDTILGNHYDYTIIADGGIQKPGDAVKALMLGADAVMMGGIFGRTYQSPGDGKVWGCASTNGEVDEYVEGVVSDGEERHSVDDVFNEFEDGIRSGLSYSGGHTIEAARQNAEFVEVTPSTQERNGGFEI